MIIIRKPMSVKNIFVLGIPAPRNNSTKNFSKNLTNRLKYKFSFKCVRATYKSISCNPHPSNNIIHKISNYMRQV